MIRADDEDACTLFFGAEERRICEQRLPISFAPRSKYSVIVRDAAGGDHVRRVVRVRFGLVGDLVAVTLAPSAIEKPDEIVALVPPTTADFFAEYQAYLRRQLQ